MRTSLAFALALITVAAFVAGCGSESPSSPGPGAGSTGNTVTIRGAGYDGGGTAGFTPGNLTVNRGTIVAWENTDTITHSVVSPPACSTGTWVRVRLSSTASMRQARSRTAAPSIPGMAGTINVRQ